jgi:hypothetical protein
MTWPRAQSESQSLLLRILYLPVPVYVAAVVFWRFALQAGWALSLAGVPLALLIGGVIYCLFLSYLYRRLNHNQPHRKGQ